jgi:RimJ/RimL family protein N-acetyltransferase
MLLRPWQPDDAPALVEAFDDPTLQRRHLRRADSDAEAEEWISGWRDTRRPASTGCSWCTPCTTRPPAPRVGEKTGFLLEGTRRSALRHADGWHDMHLHAHVAGDG